MKESIRTK